MNVICKIVDAAYAMKKAIQEMLGLKTGKPEKKGDGENKSYKSNYKQQDK